MNTKLLQNLSIFVLALVLIGPSRLGAGEIIERERLKSADAEEPPHRANRCPLSEIIQGHRVRRGPLVPAGIAPKGEDRSCRPTSVDVVDLDKRIRTHIDYTTKSYSEDSFPEPPLEGTNPINTGKLRPTGRRKKVAGYWCDEYRGSGESAHWGIRTEVDCISTDAPGVAEYNQFQDLLRRVYTKAGYGYYDVPEFLSPDGLSGIVLEQTLDCCRTGFAVTHIESKEIPASAFEPPAGFIKMCDGRCD